MKSTILALVVLLAFVPLSFSQQSASLSSGQSFSAGDVITFHIQLDKASADVRPVILVAISPKDPSARASFGGLQNVGLMAKGSTEGAVTIRIPSTAPAGTWTVDSVRLVLQGGPEVPLRFSQSDFQVSSSNAELPTSARVQIGK